MDGTLVDTEPFWLEAETELMALYGYSWTPDDQRNCLGGPLPRVGRYMQERAGVQTPEYFTAELVRRVTAKFSEGLTFMPGAIDFLRSVAITGLPIGLVSASPRELVDATVNALPKNIFTVTISSDEVVNSKPDPEPYIKAAYLVQRPIHHSLILEDSKTGITSAQSSGAWVLAIPHIVDIQEDERTMVVKSLVGLDFREVDDLYRKRSVV